MEEAKDQDGGGRRDPPLPSAHHTLTGKARTEKPPPDGVLKKVSSIIV